MDNNQKQLVLEQIKSANNVLVTVSSNPTVDELAASVGLTLALNKLEKHATTVFSGVVPSTIEFLQPEKTIETTTDSLRDFIIALDKSKADKLRYKVEDDVVRIFITPYKASISENDLEFSQGDFNVDVVLAIGVTRKEDLDKAISAHGRILHDAVVVSLTSNHPSELGQINWQEAQASSLCEMVSTLVFQMLPEGLDSQMATALLTGIIAETDRFKNEKTTPLALSLSSQLMSSGANQQLIAEKLDEPEAAPILQHSLNDNSNEQGSDGTLEISHEDDEKVEKIHIDEHGNLGLNENDSENYKSVDNSGLIANDPSKADQIGLNEEQTEVEDLTNLSDLSSNDIYSEGLDAANKSEDFDATEQANIYEETEKPSLQQPDSTLTPMMEHKQTIIEPILHEGDIPKTDKPFDLAEAMAQSATDNSAVEIPPSNNIQSPTDIDVASTPTPVMPDTQSQQSIEPQISTVPASDSLADLEKAIGSPHANIDPVSQQNNQTSAPNFLPTDSEPKDPLIQVQEEIIAGQNDNLEPPKVAETDQEDKKDPNSPPPVPPPMTPQFYDADGNNSNPFLNPHQ